MKQKVLLFLVTISCFIISGQNSYLNKIKFQEFELNIMKPISVWDEEGKLENIQKDSVYVYLDLGESIEGIKIQINQLKNGKIKIFQRFENSITIMDEGPHCDLIDWKHYNSKWNELEITDNIFLTDSYSEKDWRKFEQVNIEELKKAVKEKCGEEWLNHIKNIKSPNNYPSAVGMSRVFLKIKFKNDEIGITEEKIISFEIPMGC
jgi:hypothetical protein